MTCSRSHSTGGPRAESCSMEGMVPPSVCRFLLTDSPMRSQPLVLGLAAHSALEEKTPEGYGERINGS